MGFHNEVKPLLKLEPICCKKHQKKFLTSYWFVELGTSEDSEWYEIDP